MNAAQREALPHFVYRLYDADDRLLYIGCTRRFTGRLHDHMREKDWAYEIDHWAISDPYPNQFTARIAEGDAIRREAPIYNVAKRGIPGWMLEGQPEITHAEWMHRVDRLWPQKVAAIGRLKMPERAS